MRILSKVRCRNLEAGQFHCSGDVNTSAYDLSICAPEASG
jgi:hypothetical protein